AGRPRAVRIARGQPVGIPPRALEEAGRRIRLRRLLRDADARDRTGDSPRTGAAVPAHAEHVNRVAGRGGADVEVDRLGAVHARPRRVAFDLAIERRTRELPVRSAGPLILGDGGEREDGKQGEHTVDCYYGGAGWRTRS